MVLDRIIQETSPTLKYRCYWCGLEKTKSDSWILKRRKSIEVYAFCTIYCLRNWLLDEFQKIRVRGAVRVSQGFIHCLKCKSAFKRYVDYSRHDCI